jgi:hypothetical protein
MTTLPPLCSPANPSRSTSTRPLLPPALLLLLAARGALSVSVAPLMDGSAGVASCYAHGDNFSRPGGLEPISVPPQSLPFTLRQEERSQNLAV